MRVVPAFPIRLAAVAVLTAAGLLAAPDRAAAGCGDYVVVADVMADGSDHPPPPMAPCHGPGCSNGPESPDVPLSAPVPSPVGSDPWAALAGRAVAPDPGPGSRYAVPPDAGRPVHIPQPIFHPPRPA